MNFIMNFILQERDTLKIINHWWKINRLVTHVESWFDELLRLTGLKDLNLSGYSLVNWAMINTFIERWHYETSLFHLPHGEMTITLDDVACLLHFPIRWAFLD